MTQDEQQEVVRRIAAGMAAQGRRSNGRLKPHAVISRARVAARLAAMMRCSLKHAARIMGTSSSSVQDAWHRAYPDESAAARYHDTMRGKRRSR